MEAVKERPAAAAKKRSRADSVKQFVSTRRGAYTVAAIAATLAGLVLLVFLNQYKDDVNAGIAPAPVLTADRLIPRGTAAGEVIAEQALQAHRRRPGEHPARRGHPGSADRGQGRRARRAARRADHRRGLRGGGRSDPQPADQDASGRSRSRSTPSTGMLGTIRAGDRVDILAAFNATSATTGSGTPTLEPLMRDMRIMQNTGRQRDPRDDRQAGREARVRRRQRAAVVPAAAAGRRDGQQGRSVSQDSLKEFELSVTSEETENGGTVTITGERDAVMSAAPIKTLVAVDGAIDRRALEDVLGDPGIEVVEVLETHGELAERASGTADRRDAGRLQRPPGRRAGLRGRGGARAAELADRGGHDVARRRRSSATCSRRAPTTSSRSPTRRRPAPRRSSRSRRP